MDRCRIISDNKIKVYGSDLEELFINSTYGLSKVMYDDVDKTTKFIRGAKKIKLESDGKSSLLSNFLNKVLDMSGRENKLYPRAKILKISPTNLVAQISGVEVDEFSRKVESLKIEDEITEKNNRLEAVIVLN